MKSLFIGINYFYTNSSRIKILYNAVKDAKKSYKYIKFNYPDSCIRILVDVVPQGGFDSRSHIVYPTRENIIEALKWLCDSDVAFLHISGHALPEGIVPADYSSNSDLINLKEFLFAKTHSKLFCVFDTCHSSALLDLPNYFLSGNSVPEIVQPESLVIVCVNSCTHTEKSNDAESFSKDLYSFINNKFLFIKKSKKSWQDVINFMKEAKMRDPKQSPNLTSNRAFLPLEKNIFEM